MGEKSAGSSAAAIDGKAVGRALRAEVRPLLKAAGFTAFTDRKAWRETEHTIDHVTLRSFNAYNAGVLGCTTFSVTVEVGVIYRCFEPELTRPQDYDCTFRAILGKTVRQPFFATEWGPAADRADILHVTSDGSNLDEMVEESKRMLSSQGLPFLDRFDEPEQAFRALVNERMHGGDFGTPDVVFPGNPGSPRWHETALAIGGLVMDDSEPVVAAAPVLAGG